MPMPKRFDAYGPEYEDLLRALATVSSEKPIALDFAELRTARNFQARFNAFLLRVEDNRPIGSAERDALLAELKPKVHTYRRTWTAHLLPPQGDKMKPGRLVFSPRLSPTAPTQSGAGAVYRALAALRPADPAEPEPPSPENPHTNREHLYPEHIREAAGGQSGTSPKPASGQSAPIPFPNIPGAGNPYFTEEDGG